MKIVYNLAIRIYVLLIKAASRINPKAKLWVEGRKLPLPDLSKDPRKKIWFHCASLGEFEQGRPLIEKFRNDFPEWVIVLTFFSPSGYEVRKNYKSADHVLYLPADTSSQAINYLDRISPSIAVFVKYEFWFNYISELKKRNIDLYLVSAIFRDEQYFFSWWSGWFREKLKYYTHIFVQDVASSKLLSAHDIPSTISGDTRFDRVFEIARSASEIPLIKMFKNNGHLIVAGSTWEEDENILIPFMLQDFSDKDNLKMIIAPHEIDEEHLSKIELAAGDNILRFSKATSENISLYSILLIDNIGMLSSLYRYADVAYVGGGFGKGIHNTLEPAAYGIPVVFGNNFEKFAEAVRMVEKGAAYVVTSIRTFNEIINNLFLKEEIRHEAGRTAGIFVRENTGATDKILNYIKKSLNKKAP